MVAFKISYNDVLSLLKLDPKISMEELDDLFSYAKCEIEEYDLADDLIKVDCKTSNRPDLWGVEGLTREIEGIIGQAIGLPDLSTEPSGYILEVDASVRKIRPYIACSIVRGLKFSNFLIKQIMQLQEKVDFSYGRKRRRSSIGIYNIKMIKSPIKYEMVPRTLKFAPLGYNEEMTLDEILENHEKGIEYGGILPQKGDLPILRDINGTVLSMPPIINSNDVGRIVEETSDVLIEVTGTNLEVVQVVTVLVTQALRDRGGHVYSVEIHYPNGHEDAPPILISPRSEPYEIEVNPKDIERYLNLNLKPNDIVKLLKNRRLDVVKRKNNFIVQYPPYRADLLHWVDIAEEVVIAYGYMNIEPTDWKVQTIGRLSERTISENYVREILCGCSLQEVLTFTLTAPESITNKMSLNESHLTNCVRVANPVSLNYSVMRDRLLPGILDFLSKNTHNEYPQQLFEVGEVVIIDKKQVKTKSHAAVALAGTEVSFEHVHSIIRSLCQNLDIEFTLHPINHPEYIQGRTAAVMINQKQVGLIGELSPEIIEKWEIYMPIATIEIDLSLFPTLNLPPLLTFE